MEIPEVPLPPLEYQQFAERRALWRLLGVTSDYAALSWAEAQEAATFAGLEERHPQRFQKKDK